MAVAATTKAPERIRKWMRLHADTVKNVEYWRNKREMTEQEYLELAVEEKIARENGDFDVPDLLVQRQNQILDALLAFATSNANLERVVVSGFDSLLGLTRGDSYLTDAEDGELSFADTASQVAGG
ncbi:MULTISPECIES: hypothetical protein [unclassified Microbacterium]|uniref:hypothetical protein n=1 Tax=unclassified Microbacterium TaxID=2609290 RepID=UPI0028832AB4|nr:MULTISPECIES: hypothetical protein [unclassified Microbacterium]